MPRTPTAPVMLGITPIRCAHARITLDTEEIMNELSRDDVIAAVERKGPSRVPMHFMHYYNNATAEKYADQIQSLHDMYPDDIVAVRYNQPDWQLLGQQNTSDERAIDSRTIVTGYQSIGEICEKIVDFGRHLDMTIAQEIRRDNQQRYCLGYSWFALYERLWMLRGMENALADFYENPEGIRALMRAICDFHLAAIRAFGEIGLDGISISDDLGTQTTTMFSRQTFLDFYKPLYQEMFRAAHDYSMHTWMHCCGHVAPLLGDLIDAGLEVIHPIQHSTYPGGTSANDPRQIAGNYGDRIAFWAGIDVQYLLPRGTTAEVRNGVRELVDIFDGSKGGLVIAAGNGIMPETPFENIESFFDEAYKYGLKKREAEHHAAANANKPL